MPWRLKLMSTVLKILGEHLRSGFMFLEQSRPSETQKNKWIKSLKSLGSQAFRVQIDAL